MTVKISREFAPADRYRYDFGLPRHFGQLDTKQDASYYGNWASAELKVLFSYCEGDCTTTECDTPEEFKDEVEKFIKWTNDLGYPFLGIDLGWNVSDDIKQPWIDCGLAHLIH